MSYEGIKDICNIPNFLFTSLYLQVSVLESAEIPFGILLLANLLKYLNNFK